jgi:uncharacterized protein YdiU (UPF0061 family)
MSEKNAGWNFENTYTHLPELFFVRQNPVPVRSAKTVIFNSELAKSLGLNESALSGERGAEILAGNIVPPGADPIAQAYAGHQFGQLNMLGDGRAILLGEQRTPRGDLFDVQLKGSGQTPFSRRGDGRAALGPMLREYIISEAMHGLGIPTTRSLAVVSTGEPVFREAPLPGAVLTRVAHSHIRVGTFVYAARAAEEKGGGKAALHALADFAIARHYPGLASDPEPYLAFLRGVIDAQASLVAKWMQVGFIHGVMNTDNVAISGETIDYGPCAFMNKYSPNTVFSSIDRNGRYAFGNQPQIAAWNLARFAEALVPILATTEDEAVAKARQAVQEFSARFQFQSLRALRAKLGLAKEEEGDSALVSELWNWMENQKADYTNTFRALSKESLLAYPQFQGEEFRQWHSAWQARLAREGDSKDTLLRRMRAHNPAVIPRNHKVEEALEAAVEREDLSALNNLLAALKNPYEESSLHHGYEEPPLVENENYQTFCGT